MKACCSRVRRNRRPRLRGLGRAIAREPALDDDQSRVSRARTRLARSRVHNRRCGPTSIVFGTAPALRGTRVQPNDALKAQGRSIVGDGRFSLGNLLVIAQVALSLMLVVAAGLFVRTFSSLARLDLGFERDRVLIVTVNAQRAQIAAEDRLAVFDRVRQAVRSVPGVADASLSVITPVTGQGWNGNVDVSDVAPLPGRQSMTFKNSSHARLVRNTRDAAHRWAILQLWLTAGAAPLVAIVNQAFVRRFMNGASPIGHIVRDRSDRRAEE